VKQRGAIYVLRAKMVDYLTLPGECGFAGNAAAGAAFLNALQKSPLSGHYTAYNYYLLSAIDAGTLGGVQAQVGGQVHADAASYVLRQPMWLLAASTNAAATSPWASMASTIRLPACWPIRRSALILNNRVRG
jgi:hypothetical protein